MELILISSSKLKIMLSGADMEKYELDADSAECDNDATRRAFRSILDDVKSKTGFGTEGERIFIQLYPSRDGGCELFVTKMGIFGTHGEGAKPLSPRQSTTLAKHRVRIGDGGSRERARAYLFDTTEHLLAVCKRLLLQKWKGKSEAYCGDNGKCYLLLADKPPEKGDTLDRLAFITEYGKCEDFDRVRLYIREHATCLCEGQAVQTLGIL